MHEQTDVFGSIMFIYTFGGFFLASLVYNYTNWPKWLKYYSIILIGGPVIWGFWVLEGFPLNPKTLIDD